MYIFLYFLFFLTLFCFFRRNNGLFLLLVLLHLISFVLQFFVGHNCPFSTSITFYNILFICSNMLMVLIPWSKIDFVELYANTRFIKRLEAFLYPLLFCNWAISLFIGIVVYIFVPEIKDFKGGKQYIQLYDTIPGFALLFRAGSIVWNFGLIAIPLVFYYASKGLSRKALIAGVLSLSSLVYSFANYSRAGIVTFALSYLAYYLLVKSTLPEEFRLKFDKLLKKAGVILIVGFLTMTFIRFSSMGHYGDRIPTNSIVRDPVLYSIVDYISQSHENGLYCMELYKTENCLNGESFFYLPILILSSFNIIQGWDVDSFMVRAERAYSGNYIWFNGYVASGVCDFGYFFTFLFDLFVFLYLTVVLRRERVSLPSCLYLLLLLQLPLNSIYYNALSSVIFPFLFILIMTILYNRKFVYKTSLFI